MHTFQRPTEPYLSVERRPVRGKCPECGAEELAQYRVLGDGGWFDVRSVASQESPDGWALIMQHEDGSHTAVPLAIAEADPVTIEKDVRDRLNQAHGYRSLP